MNQNLIRWTNLRALLTAAALAASGAACTVDEIGKIPCLNNTSCPADYPTCSTNDGKTPGYCVAHADAAKVALAAGGGDGQSVVVGSAAPTALKVLVTDTAGNPSQGATVTWAVVSGGGSLLTPVTTSGPDGTATATAVTGVKSGTNTYSASVVGLSGSPVTFTITGTPGDATSFKVVFPLSAIPAHLYTATVSAFDANGNQTRYSGKVNVTTTPADANAVLPSSVQLDIAETGTSTVSGIALAKVSAGQTVTITDTKVATLAGSQAGVVVGPGVTITGLTAVVPNGSIQFSASGGSGTGFTWAVTTNASGGSINLTSGQYTAGTTGSTSDVVTATDSVGNSKTVSIAVGSGISISSSAPSPVAPKDTRTFSASGGKGAPFTWSMKTAPSGGSISASTGVYLAGLTGSVTDTIKVADSLGNIATLDVPVSPSVSITPGTGTATAPPKGSINFAAAGGLSGPGFTWALSTSPSGGSIVSTTGVYTAGATGTVTDVVVATDTLGNQGTASIAVTAAVAIAGAATTPPKGTVNFTATGGAAVGGANASFVWSLSNAPSGGSINATTGVYLAGANGTSTDTVMVTDKLGNVATKTIGVTAGITITGSATTTPKGTVTLTAAGGSGNYTTWQLLTNNSSGTIVAANATTATYTAGINGSVTDKVQVTDSLGNVATFNLGVSAGVSISGTNTVAPLGTRTLTAAGGTNTGFVWTVSTNNSVGATVATATATTATYTAGNTPNVVDTVKVTDSLGNFGTFNITVGNGISITNATASIFPRATRTMTATGGSGTGFTWQLTANPSGGNITGGGLYTAGSVGGQSDSIKVTDSTGNVGTATIQVSASVSITGNSNSPPKGTKTLTAVGGSGTGFTWSITANNSVSATITPASATTATYLAGATGSVIDSIQVTDSLGNVGTTTVQVTGGVTVSSATTTSTPTKGTLTLNASGGSGSGFNWSFVGSPGSGGSASITGSGASVVYRAGTQGNSSDTIQAVDSLNNVGSITISVGGGIIITSGTTFSTPPLGSLALNASGGSGTGFQWTIVTPDASGGAVIGATTGSFTAGPNGNTTVTVQVTDSLSNVATHAISVGPGITITGAAPTAPRASRPLTASGGNGVFATWSFVTGQNKSGGTIVALNATQATYTAGPTPSVTDQVQVTDSLGNVSPATSIVVGPGITISNNTPGVASTLTRTLSATGGSGTGFNWTLTSNPSGGSIGLTTGVYTAGNTALTTDAIQVVDSVGNSATSTIAVLIGAISTAKSVVTTGASTVASGSTISVQLQAKDAGGNNLPAGGSTIVFTATSTDGSSATMVTNADPNTGVYTGTLTGVFKGTLTVGATIGGVAVTSALPTVTVTPGPISAAKSTVSALSNSLLSGTSTTVTLQAKDAAGNNLVASSGAFIVFTATPLASGTATFSGLTDNTNGTYTATMTAVLAGTFKLGATIDGAALTTTLPTITVSPGSINAAKCTVSSVLSTLSSGNTTTVTLQAKDAAGNNLTASSGAAIAFSATALTGGTATFSGLTDNNNGTYSAAMLGVASGTLSLGATVNATAIGTTLPVINVIDATPTISSLTPNNGPVGTTVTIAGTNFNTTAANNAVLFGVTPATVSAASATSLTVTVPSVSTGATTVTVQAGSGTTKSVVSAGAAFTVLDPTPVITSLTPNSGPVGATVIIAGTSFNTTAANNAVLFGGVAATVSAATAVQLTVVVPTLASGSVNVTVQSGTGATKSLVSAASPFTVLDPTPTISSLNPTTGPVGTTVTISGANFNTTAANNAVLFGGVAATVSAATAAQLTVTVPTMSTGATTVTVQSGSGATKSLVSATSPFTVLDPTPTIASLTPTSGPVGATVIIAGTNFNTTAANNTVKFGTTAATVSAATAIQLTVTVPSVASGTTSVTVQSGSGITKSLVSSGSSFTVLDPTPTIASLTPTSGPVGATVIIAGTNFNTTAANNAVLFGATAATVSAATAIQLTVTVPTMSTGATSVTVQSGSGVTKSLVSSGSAFTVLDPTPTISSLTPSSGPVGTTVTIAGANFNTTAANNTVLFGATAATVSAATAIQLTVTVPTMASGATSVTVQSGSGVTKSNVSAGSSFTVLDPTPTISSLTPTSGPVGTTVIIAGTNFNTTAANNTVLFGATAATVSAATAIQLTVTVPSVVSGATSVTVQSGSGVTKSLVSSGSSFTVLDPTPTIASLTPTSGPVGTTVIIAGTNFNTTAANNTVLFGATTATVSAATAIQLTVTVPTMGTGATSVTVQSGSGATKSNVSLGSSFTVLDPTPTVASVVPSFAVAGASVVITGTGFSATTGQDTVKFGGTNATVTAATPTQLTVTVPGITLGVENVTVQVNTSLSSSPAAFTVVDVPLFSTAAALILGTGANANKIFVTGGTDVAGYPNTGTVRKTTWIFDPAVPGAPVRGPDLTVQRAYHTATAIGSDKVVIGGGALNEFEICDLTAGSCTSVAGGSGTARCNGAAALVAAGKVLLVGGDNCVNASARQTWSMVDTTAGNAVSTSTGGTQLTTARRRMTATPLGSSKVLVAGGDIGGGTGELFDTNNFTTNLTMAVARQDHTATLLAAGTNACAAGDVCVLVAGGLLSGTTKTWEIYSKTSVTFTTAPVTNELSATARSQHAAVKFSNGKVMLIGGTSDGGTTPLTSVEVFAPATAGSVNLNNVTISAGTALSVARMQFPGILNSTSDLVTLFGGSSSLPLEEQLTQP